MCENRMSSARYRKHRNGVIHMKRCRNVTNPCCKSTTTYSTQDHVREPHVQREVPTRRAEEDEPAGQAAIRHPRRR